MSKTAVLGRLKFVQLVALAAFSATFGVFGAWLYDSNHPGVNSLDSKTQAQVISSESQLFENIASKVGESVVSIDVTSTASGFFRDYSSSSAGTGIIISADGYILTNKHVIPDGATKVSVTLSDGKVYDNVDVVARDPRSSVDIAFLKIKDVKDLKPAALGESSKMKVGDKVVAIGNALGQFQNTVTTGIISGIGRPITAGDESDYYATGNTENLSNLFQTDAAINPGNSGGPLVNTSGEVIGINTAVAGDAQNIGFAIPIDDVKSSIKSILDKGKLEVPYLGVRYIQLDEAAAKQFNLDQTSGAFLYTTTSGQEAVVSDSPAEKAGLKERDIITKVDDTTLDDSHQLSALIAKYSVGDSAKLTIIRDGKQQTVDVTFGAAPNNN